MGIPYSQYLIRDCKPYAQSFFLITGQARLDGAFCEYEEEDKMKFLRNAKEHGVCNIEMESLGFLALCNHAGVPGKYR